MIIPEGRVGPVLMSDGATREDRLDITGCLVVADGHGRYREPASRSRIFTLITKSATLAAANVSPVAANSGQLIVGIFNPPDSGVNVSILYGCVATVSGTPGGPFYWNETPADTTTATETGTILQQPLTVNTKAGSVCRAVNNVALAGMLKTAVEVGVLGGPAAVAAGAGVYTVAEEVAGAFEVRPGTIFGIACHAAGTSHVVSASLRWEEIQVR